jgi:DUF1009 family protein
VIGLIAGSKSLPFLFAREARRRGESVAAVAFEGETDPKLAAEVDSLEWVRVGQLSKMIQALRSRGVQRCVMLGQIAPRNLFDVRPDLRAMALLMRLKQKNAHTVFGAIGDELGKDGIELVPAVPWLTAWMPGSGDACLERGGLLAGKSGGAVAVKLAKAGHDLRFDIPCVGPKTVETCARSGIRVLGFEAGMTLLLELEELEAHAKSRGVSLVSVDASS